MVGALLDFPLAPTLPLTLMLTRAQEIDLHHTVNNTRCSSSMLDRFNRQEVAHDQRRTETILAKSPTPGTRHHSHVVVVPPDSEGKAAFDLGVICFQVGITQRTAREHCLLRLVESNRTELLPVADELVFDYDLVNRELALQKISAIDHQVCFLSSLTSRNDSIGT